MWSSIWSTWSKHPWRFLTVKKKVLGIYQIMLERVNKIVHFSLSSVRPCPAAAAICWRSRYLAVVVRFICSNSWYSAFDDVSSDWRYSSVFWNIVDASRFKCGSCISSGEYELVLVDNVIWPNGICKRKWIHHKDVIDLKLYKCSIIHGRETLKMWETSICVCIKE